MGVGGFVFGPFDEELEVVDGSCGVAGEGAGKGAAVAGQSVGGVECNGVFAGVHDFLRVAPGAAKAAEAVP